MNQSNSDVKLGRFLSLVLRHDPHAAGITLDGHGWADVDALLAGVNRTGRKINMDTLERIVRENSKQRYAFNEDHTKIRANQGHSVRVDVELKAAEPPKYLYHGTATRFLPAIEGEGIRRMSRQYVHLSGDFETAMAVASATVSRWSSPSTRRPWPGMGWSSIARKTACGCVSMWSRNTSSPSPGRCPAQSRCAPPGGSSVWRKWPGLPEGFFASED